MHIAPPLSAATIFAEYYIFSPDIQCNSLFSPQYYTIISQYYIFTISQPIFLSVFAASMHEQCALHNAALLYCNYNLWTTWCRAPHIISPQYHTIISQYLNITISFISSPGLLAVFSLSEGNIFHLRRDPGKGFHKYKSVPRIHSERIRFPRDPVFSLKFGFKPFFLELAIYYELIFITPAYLLKKWFFFIKADMTGQSFFISM